ncbi:MAG: leucine-rich repeat protein, partial [Oscillospiraceae bacterium]|nr:leucine-rich repeat protein [Oscillospiraceae bacterium]
TTEKTVYPGGKTIDTTTVKQEDGSFTTLSETTDASGNVISTTSIVSSIDTDGVTTRTTDTYNADGTSLNSILKTSKSHEVLYSYVKEVKLDRKGSIVVTSDTVNENGTKVSKVYKAVGDGVKVSSFKSDKGTVTIPSTITIAGRKVPVTTIAGGAFKNDLTLTKVKIGKNVTVIGKNAFKGAKNLRSIVIYGDLTEVHKGAFKGIAPDAVIKIKADKENFDRIVAMIKASGISRTVKFKRVK